jgi:hypothetical protein
MKHPLGKRVSAMNKDKQLKKANFYKKFFPKKIPRYNPAKLKFIARIIEKKYLEGDELFCLPNDHVINWTVLSSDYAAILNPGSLS